MHYTTWSLLLSILPALAFPFATDVHDVPQDKIDLAIPEDFETESTFTVPAIPNPNFRRDGFLELKKAYHKYQRHFSYLVIPPGLLNYTTSNYTTSEDLLRRGARTGSSAAVPVGQDIMYLAPVYIGNQKFNLNFDTGSSDLWVFSNKLPKSLQTQRKKLGGTLYTPAANIKPVKGFTWGSSYVDGSTASGVVVVDKVKIGGITVAKQAVGMTSKVSRNLEYFNGDGILGLAFSILNSVAPTKQKTWFENALPQLKAKVFTANLNRLAVGSYDWGYINPKYSKRIGWAKLRTSSGWWHVDAAGGIKVNGKSATDRRSYNLGAVLDTGSSLLLLPDPLVKLYYAKVPKARYIPEAGAWVYPCTSDSLQSFGNPSALPFIYGDVFFKANFGVFDFGNRRFGFSQK
ncbi:Type I transmembrane sorting receptor [Orbilia brochopaga]|uniref:Type I transmembrane sorting receptor n=1 Tax=Orbilia brochopaga TaxID=3140254 RepID=A0AAV9UNS2_9PEZI